MNYMLNYKPAFDFDKVLDNVFSGNRYSEERNPAVDVIDTPESYRLEAELPGLTENDVDVNVNDRVLTIQSSVKKEDTPTFLIRERRGKNFSRSFLLPRDVDAEKINGSFSNGVLTLVLEKTAEAQPKKIKVKAA